MENYERPKSELRRASELQIKEIPASDRPASADELRQTQQDQAQPTEHKLPLTDLAIKGGSQGVLIIDADQRIVSLNAGFEAITESARRMGISSPPRRPADCHCAS